MTNFIDVLLVDLSPALLLRGFLGLFTTNENHPVGSCLGRFDLAHRNTVSQGRLGPWSQNGDRLVLKLLVGRLLGIPAGAVLLIAEQTANLALEAAEKAA